ncbi:MAG TPA: 50S ribosomal protein L11 methyltransferase [Oscillospiraceae bacterium]|nr:50S ribosomal protein L11 methyltransferase [Oscillospiraceae bacterium]
MRWLELIIHTRKESSEAIAAKLLALGTGGVSFEESWLWEQAKKDGLDDLFPTPSAGGLQDDIAILRGYFPVSFLGSASEKELHSFLLALPSFGLPEADLKWRYVDDVEWENRWKDYWFPTPVGKKLLIVPTWRQVEEDEDRLKILLDPGAAFGTGSHETTQLCLGLLEMVIAGGDKVLDLGCGSGILSIAAHALGAEAVLGLDYDEVAIRISRENAILNGSPEIKFVQRDLFKETSWQTLPTADVIVANLTADILLKIKHHLPAVLRPGGKIILSGIIKERAEEVMTTIFTQGYQLLAERSAGEWVALLGEREA